MLVLTCSFIVWIAPTNSAADEDITISSNTTWSAGTYTYQDITITNNAILTLNGAYTSDTDGSGVVINARNITIDSGAAISATGKGYAANTGAGKGGIYSAYGGGASHAANGGNHAIGSGGGTVLYGSATAPLTLGSGGGNGGAGGGAISMNLSGDLTLAGNIYAKGNNGGTNTGGGAGGSIYIAANDLSGAGNISASGGSAGSGGGGGSGGRIGIYYTGTNSLTRGNITSAGGTGAVAGGGGSIWIYDRTNKDMTIDANMILNPTMGVDVNGLPSTDGVFNFRNLTVNNNAILYNRIKNSTDSDGVGIELKLTGDLNVASGSKIDGIGLGYARGTGEGKPTGLSNTYGGGGAHGGNGGRGEVGVGGIKYDSTLFPVKPGSGGYTTKGGQGGSAIKITAVDIVVDGSIDQSASAATGDGGTNGSGGAGGSIYIVSSTVSGSGTIKADASNGYGYSGGGGGGRIAIYSNTTGFTASNITAAKGTKGGSGASADGEVGTVFLYDTASGNVSASNDVTFYANQGVGRDGSPRTDGVFYFNNLNVTNNATVTIAGNYTNDSDGRGVTINLDGNLTIDSGSKITSDGQGFGAGFGPGKGSGGSSTSGSGGSYGGVGGQSYNNNLAPAVYGATEANYPFRLGSSGGAGDQISGTPGGGAVTLRVLGNIVNNGTISADGSIAKASPIPGWFTGGGSGGSVFLVCDSLSGSGTVSAKGGNGSGTDYGSGGGGGGRISVVYSTAQNLALGNFSAAGGTGGGGVANRNGAEGSVNITQRILPAADFVLKNPNNNSSQFTNTENVEIVPSDGSVQKYKDATSVAELVPTFYAEGWNNVADGKDVGATEGTKTVRAWFKDGNELISSSVGTASITLDKTSPTILITNNIQTVQESTAKITLTLDDDISGIDYLLINGQTIDIASLTSKTTAKASSIKAYAAESTYEATVNLSVGDNTIPVVAYDKAGNSTETSFVATRVMPAGIDTPTPTITPTPTSTASPTAGTQTTTPTPTATQTSSSGTSVTATSLSNQVNTDSVVGSGTSPTSNTNTTDVTDLSSSLDGNDLSSAKAPAGENATRKPAKIYYYLIALIILGELIYLLFRKKIKK